METRLRIFNIISSSTPKYTFMNSINSCIYIVTYKGLSWLIIVGSKFDDWIYWMPQYNSSHTELLFDNESLTAVWILNWSLVSSLPYLAVRISYWANFMRTEYRTPIRTVDSSVILCFHETCLDLLLREKCLPSRGLATDDSVVHLWLRTSGFQASCHNILTYLWNTLSKPSGYVRVSYQHATDIYVSN
jgi:hypothetical protein